LVVNVTVYDQAPEASKLRDLAVQLGCSFSQLGAPDVASGIIEAARAIGAEHIVIGEVARRTGLARFRPSLVEKVIANAPDSDIHVIARRAG
jgi:K+-sensing histidine kinase KdpD